MRGVSLSSPGDYEIEDGESFRALQQRVANVLAELPAAGLSSVLVVTHAGPLHAMLQILMPEKPNAFVVRFHPGSITRLRKGSKGTHLMTLNDTAHLAGAHLNALNRRSVR